MKRWVLKAEHEGKICNSPSMTSTGRKFLGYYSEDAEKHPSAKRVQYPEPTC